MRKDKLEKKLNLCLHLYLLPSGGEEIVKGNNREGLGLLEGIYEGGRSWELDGASSSGHTPAPTVYSGIMCLREEMRARNQTSCHCNTQNTSHLALRGSHRGKTISWSNSMKKQAHQQPRVPWERPGECGNSGLHVIVLHFKAEIWEHFSHLSCISNILGKKKN